MPDADDIFERMQRTQFGWHPSDFEKLYVGFGFAKEEDTNHTTYIHLEYRHLITQVARHRKLSPAYSRTAVKIIRELKELQSTEEDNGDC